jgi:molecular chaperone DnaJ
MTAAALGTTVTLETLDGPEAIEVRAGTQSGSTKTLRGRGVTHLRSNGRGDLHVHLAVATPTKLDGAQQELLRQLAAMRGEENPVGQVARGQSGLFTRIRDAFR